MNELAFKGCTGCGNLYGVTRYQCHWCRLLFCHQCIIEGPHNGCQVCTSAHMTDSDRASSVLDALEQPVAIDWATPEFVTAYNAYKP